MRPILFIIVISLLVVSCSHVPAYRQKSLASDKVKKIVIGKTTQREIYGLFGKPQYYGQRSPQNSWWFYVFTTGLNSQSLSLYFDEENKVEDFHYSPFEKTLSEKQAVK